MINVLARMPVRGSVKTRLAHSIGSVATLRAYRWMLDRTMRAALDTGLPVCLWSAGGRWHSALQSYGVPVRVQPPGNLGRKMAHVLSWSAARGSTSVLVGTDCPGLDTETLDAGVAALANRDVVIGPATDGGYYLIGARRAWKGLFAKVPWGSSLVLRRTLQLIRRRGLSVELLGEKSDVDVIEDWRSVRVAAGRGAVDLRHAGAFKV